MFSCIFFLFDSWIVHFEVSAWLDFYCLFDDGVMRISDIVLFMLPSFASLSPAALWIYNILIWQWYSVPWFLDLHRQNGIHLIHF